MTSTLQPSPDLAAHMRAVYAAMEAGDPDAVEALYSLADGTVFVGSSEDEFWTDSARHNADVRPLWQPGSVAIEPGDISASVGQLEADGRWRVVHSHASVGQP